MIARDYYRVLGVPRTESQRGIRKAFRDLARQHHPDRAGPSGTPAFREVVEAYRVLSDPEARRVHDAGLRRGFEQPAGAGPRVSPRRRAGAFDRVELFREPAAVRPAADALLDRIFRNFAGRAIPKSERPESLSCDVVLTREEAARGGILPISLPVRAPCPRCHGSGHLAGYECGACDAEGAITTEAVVPLRIAPGLPSGTTVEIPLDQWGIRNLWLRVRIDVVH